MKKRLRMIEELPPRLGLHFDISPSTCSLRAYLYVPSRMGADRRHRRHASNIKDEWLLPRIKKDMSELHEDDFMIAQAPGNEILVGRSLRESKEIYGVPDAPRSALPIDAGVTTERGTCCLRISTPISSRARSQPSGALSGPMRRASMSARRE